MLPLGRRIARGRARRWVDAHHPIGSAGTAARPCGCRRL